MTNKDGGAHIDRLNAAMYDFIHSNSAGFVSISVPEPGSPGGAAEPVPTPVYASIRTIAEELLLTLQRSGRQVPRSTAVPELGMIDSFTAGDHTGNVLEPDLSREDASHTSIQFGSLPGVTFRLSRLQSAQSDPAFDGEIPAGWLAIVGTRDSSGEVVHQSGGAGPTETDTAPPDVPHDFEIPAANDMVTFGFDNFPQATFTATRASTEQVTESPWGKSVRGAGWIELFITLNGATWPLSGFAGPPA